MWEAALPGDSLGLIQRETGEVPVFAGTPAKFTRNRVSRLPDGEPDLSKTLPATSRKKR